MPQLETGTYTAYLMKDEVVLDSITFSLSSDYIPDQPYKPDDDIFAGLDGRLGALIGVIIIISFLLIPLVVGGIYAVDVPPLVYALFGGLGLVISVYFHFIDLWVIFFLIVVGIIITLILYFRE